MSAPQDKRTETTPTQEQEQQQQTKPTKKADDKKTDAQPKKTKWASAPVTRGTAVDIRIYTDFKAQNDSQYQFSSLPTTDGLSTYDLTPSTYGKDSDMTQVFTDLSTFLADVDPWAQQHEDGSFYGSSCSEAFYTPTRFSVGVYRNNDQVVFCIRQYDGCGIQFARFFAKFNQEFGADREREIHTFEAPPLAPLPQDLQVQLSNLSLNGTDSCVFEHEIPNSLVWSVDTISSLRDSILPNQALRYAQEEKFNQRNLLMPEEHADECCDDLIIPGCDAHDDDVAEEFPITDQAQGRMLCQAFQTLNGTIQAIAAQERGVSDQERAKLGEFFASLQEQEMLNDAAIYKCAALLQHPIVDVQLATVECLVSAVQAGLMDEATTQNLALLVLQHCEPQFGAENSTNPFDRIAYQKMQYAINSVAQCANLDEEVLAQFFTTQ